MAESTAHPQRFDPYKNFEFRVKWDGHYVAGVSKVSGLKRATEVVEQREDDDPGTIHKGPGCSEYEAITLERGVTYDPDFGAWAANSAPGGQVSLAGFRKDLILDVFNEAGQLAISYHINRCWVSEYRALPDLDANADAVAIQHLKIENEGWYPDVSVMEPTEPSPTWTHA